MEVVCGPDDRAVGPAIGEPAVRGLVARHFPQEFRHLRFRDDAGGCLEPTELVAELGGVMPALSLGGEADPLPRHQVRRRCCRECSFCQLVAASSLSEKRVSEAERVI